MKQVSYLLARIRRKVIKYAREFTPKRANIPGVRVKYRLTGIDQINETIINALCWRIAERIAKQAGRHNIMNVIRAASGSKRLE
ncbi:hypothetical protein [Paenibacillus foliorum]|uniref:hypothetical protein n=1 Tax=Paenibacillus foliorum TaxID=2654974 RepID=UPI00149189D5|nr:hypothetical protein [Paenibacillus foliorum]